MAHLLSNTEVENSLQLMLGNKLKELDLDQHLPYVFQKVKEAFLGSVDYSSYGLTDVVHLDDFDAELCESFLLHRDLKTKVQLLDAIEEFFEVKRANSAMSDRDLYDTHRKMKPSLYNRFSRSGLILSYILLLSL